MELARKDSHLCKGRQSNLPATSWASRESQQDAINTLAAKNDAMATRIDLALRELDRLAVETKDLDTTKRLTLVKQVLVGKITLSGLQESSKR